MAAMDAACAGLRPDVGQNQGAVPLEATDATWKEISAQGQRWYNERPDFEQPQQIVDEELEYLRGARVRRRRASSVDGDAISGGWERRRRGRVAASPRGATRIIPRAGRRRRRGGAARIIPRAGRRASSSRVAVVGSAGNPSLGARGVAVVGARGGSPSSRRRACRDASRRAWDRRRQERGARVTPPPRAQEEPVAGG